ncbi:3-oxo-5-alpha-steroid 4-dehydrogenase 1 [[Emmonsia] crescens]|uniref:3-oxo-5-alpha-steroid 4-dehydrogenase 1 n=1 Tax=[Emmonsia] crescens TaxID=73230 RepID=A0A2B7ZII2_9EURO|nr:3-oxo-5-alpha-steroid 4-dehydrogenase 1 [Emmonsia crescens]
MGSLIKWSNSLPPLQEFLPPASPEAYIVLLTIFQYFPMVALIQLATPFYPQGKTSLPSSRLNFPGRYAWLCMESVGALNLLYTLCTGTSRFPDGQFPIWHKIVACLYVLHYLNRAVITPLFLAPSMSPIHLIIIFSAMGFNYLNSSCIAGWLLGYGTPILGSTAPTRLSSTSSFSTKYFPAEYIPYIGLCLFLIGMYGNIKAEGTLFRLRREQVDNNTNKANPPQNPKNKYDKVYVLPPSTGWFRTILFPHYVFEWLEWFGFLLIGFSITPAPSTTSSATTTTSTSALTLAPYYAPLANHLLDKWGISFPLPAIAFLVNVISTTAVRASWGRKWYVDRFGVERVGRRGAFVPYFKWL